MRETRIERKLRVGVKQQGGKALKFVSPGWRGAPDRILLLPGGRLWFVELKAPGKKPTPLQQKRLRDLVELGFNVKVISNLDELERFLNEIT